MMKSIREFTASVRDLTVFNHPVWKYLVIVPMLISIGFGILNGYVSREAKAKLLEEKFVEKIRAIDRIAGDIDFFADTVGWGALGLNEQILSRSMADEDAQPMTYAALFTETFENVSARSPSYSSAFEPLEDSAYCGFVRSNDSGVYLMPYTPADAPEREMHIYHRWVPSDNRLEGRYLLIVAISEYSITNNLASWVNASLLSQTAYLFVTTICLTLLIVKAGVFLGKREKAQDGTIWRERDAAR